MTQYKVEPVVIGGKNKFQVSNSKGLSFGVFDTEEEALEKRGRLERRFLADKAKKEKISNELQH